MYLYKHLLAHSTSPNTSYGRRSFQVASFELFNHFPRHVKSAKTMNQFKSALKTHLLVISYSYTLYFVCYAVI